MLNSYWYVPHVVIILLGALFDSYEEAKEVVPGSRHLNLVDIKLSKKADSYGVKKTRVNFLKVLQTAYK